MRKRSIKSLIVLLLIFVMLLCSCSKADETADINSADGVRYDTAASTEVAPGSSSGSTTDSGRTEGTASFTSKTDDAPSSEAPVAVKDPSDAPAGAREGGDSIADALYGLLSGSAKETTSDESGSTYESWDIAADDGEGWATDSYVESESDWGAEVVWDVDEPYIPDVDPYLNAIQPGAHMLTAGEWNDNKNFGFIKNLVRNGQDYDYGGLFKKWDLNPMERLTVSCQAANKPVENATVEVYGQDGSLIWTGKTDNTGTSYCFFSLHGDNKPGKVVVTNQGEVKERVFENGVSDSALVNFTLDNASSNEKKLELMYVVDTTGSMGDEISFLQCELADVIERVRTENSNLPISLSVNFYKDEGDVYVVRSNDFSTNIDEQVALVMKEYASGGGDYEEAVEQALENAVNGHKWSEDATKILFLVLDAPPHNRADIRSTLARVITQAAEMGIRIIPVAASGIDKETEFLLRTFAMATGGTYTFLTNDSGIGGDHIEASVGAYEVEYLNDLMVRVIGEYLQDVEYVEEQEYGLDAITVYEDDLVDDYQQ